jgi:hypothetical protein
MAGLPIFKMRGSQALLFEGEEADFASYALGSHFVNALKFPVQALAQLKRIGGIQDLL